MDVFRTSAAFDSGDRKVCLAMGFFDGVHLGHQQILRQTVSDARLHSGAAVVLTFDRHPRSVLAPEQVPPLVYPLAQKLRAIAQVGADAVLLLHFDEALCRKSGEVFIRELARDLRHLQSISVGSNFLFGHNRGGNVALLQRLGQELGFGVHGVASVSLDGQPVSSTRIRGTIQSGELDLAGQMLGRPYSLCGRVVKGQQLGRTLGFPTANLDCRGLVLPPFGVYAVRLALDGQSRRGVLNIGRRPTVAAGSVEISVEVHLLDFEGDLYGRELELVIGQKLRDERKFPNVQALKEQIVADVSRAAALLA